jgi:hypothetical protein
MDLEKHRKEIRQLVTQAPEEPTYCEFKEKLSYGTKKEKGELVKDVSSFGNIDLEALGGFGYLIFGVSNKGDVVGTEDPAGDPPSDTRKIVNGHLSRPVHFEYITCDVDDKAGSRKKVAAIVVPSSSRRPHVIPREIKEQQGNKSRFWLREGEVWVRKTGGREIASAEDYDAMYEGKLRRLVEDAVRPLQETVARIQEEFKELKSVTPELSLGFSMPNWDDPLPEAAPTSVLGIITDPKDIQEELEEAKQRSKTKPSSSYSPLEQNWAVVGGKPSAEDYGEYLSELEEWLQDVEELLLLDFTLSNTGQIPAEDVKVVLKIPVGLQPREDVPLRPEPPRETPSWPLLAHSTLPEGDSWYNAAESLGSPYVEEQVLGSQDQTTNVWWEIDKLHHGRPLSTVSNKEELEGLIISREGYRNLVAREGDAVEFEYEIHAANLRVPQRGKLFLK